MPRPKSPAAHLGLQRHGEGSSVFLGVKALSTSLAAATVHTLIRKHLVEAGIGVVALCSDSGPPNPTAMSEWIAEAAQLYFGQELRTACFEFRA
jgi:hypothetical protein